MEQCRAKQGVAATSRRHHVATSPSHDVGSTMQKSTIQQRRDVTTSRRHHVATSARKSASHHLMYERLGKWGHREAYEERHRIPEQIETDSEEEPGICTAFHLLDIISDILMMFLILDILIFSFMMF